MSVKLASNSYGKSSVRLLKVARTGARHEIRDLTVDIALEGAFEAAHIAGENEDVLPTDTMKNTVYAKAAEQALGEPEDFAAELVSHFLGACGAARTATVSVAEHGWRRLAVRESDHDHAFERGSGEMRTARVSATRDGERTVSSGIRDLVILKSAHSAFTGFPRDRFTTLAETEDRILATSLTTSWRYTTGFSEYGPLFVRARRALIEAFATHDSRSVQHTLYAMGAAMLEQCAEVEEVALSMPNRHHLPVDVARFGMRSDNEIFLPSPEPYGLIEATLRRNA